MGDLELLLRAYPVESWDPRECIEEVEARLIDRDSDEVPGWKSFVTNWSVNLLSFDELSRDLDIMVLVTSIEFSITEEYSEPVKDGVADSTRHFLSSAGNDSLITLGFDEYNCFEFNCCDITAGDNDRSPVSGDEFRRLGDLDLFDFRSGIES